MKKEFLSIKGARVHNLKNISLQIPKNELVVITGLSGSGKSSLAFDTIYAEGQRRYMESLSSYARQFLELQDKPDVDEINGLSPTIAIDQKSSSHNPRSTVGTVTEIYDFLRVLFARAGRPHCPNCKLEIKEQTLSQSVQFVEKKLGETTWKLCAPIILKQKGEHKHIFQKALQSGFTTVFFNGNFVDTTEALSIRKDKKQSHDISYVVFSFEKEKTYTKEQIQFHVKKTMDLGSGALLLVSEDEQTVFPLSLKYMCSTCFSTFAKPEPRLFSFNSPHGACVECTGLGEKLIFEAELVVPNKRLTIAQGAIRPLAKISGNQNSTMKLIEAFCVKHKMSLHEPLEKYSGRQIDLLLNGTGEEIYEIDQQSVIYSGLLSLLDQKYKETDSEYVKSELEGYMRKLVCPSCEGKRLQPYLLSITVNGKNISDFVHQSIDDSRILFKEYKDTEMRKGIFSQLSKEEFLVCSKIAKEVDVRLKQLQEVGLGYLTLDRSAMTLSGGEAQRVRLATQLGSGLSGVIYILDEPSIGLHPRDNDALIQTIRKLQQQGNTVIVVEHDETMIESADYVFDIGPGAGEYGGEIVAQGKPSALKKQTKSLTGQYLSGKKSIAISKNTRKGDGKFLRIIGANAFNLKNVQADIPLGMLVCVSGVSGSGKSTLVLDILGKALSKHFFRAKEFPGDHSEIQGLEHIDKVVAVDQSPIGRTPRSNPATYTGVFTAIRDLFTEVPEAKAKKYDAGKFSFNVKEGGRCETCCGDGVKRIEMQFLPDVYVECESCHGTRYNDEAREIHYKGKTISDVLQMTVEEAKKFFSDQSSIYEKLNVLFQVGLGYLRLGQSATTLSGGEAQRVKLATELSRRSTGKTLYILDEPTTGLHFEDVKRLLNVLHQLVDKGNTVVVIEHNLDVIKTSDWVIDMGPEGGEKGGKIVAQGTPKEIAKNKESVTGVYLKSFFK